MLGTISHGNCDENIMKQVRMLLDVGSCLWYCFGISMSPYGNDTAYPYKFFLQNTSEINTCKLYYAN